MVRRRRQTPITVCVTPGCISPPVTGRRFCEGCTTRLARVRDDLNAEGMRRHLMPGGRKSLPGRAKKRPMCCNPQCYEPRTPPAAFCVGCQDAGWNEEED